MSLINCILHNSHYIHYDVPLWMKKILAQTLLRVKQLYSNSELAQSLSSSFPSSLVISPS